MKLRILLMAVLLPFQVHALYTEIGASYLYKQSFVDNYNNLATQGVTGSVSFYFWERVAVEASYTNSLQIKKEQAVSASSLSVITSTETDNIYGMDLIYIFSDHKASFQPYVKGGIGYIVKTQVSQIDNNPPWTIGPYTGWSPSYGAGLKYLIADALAIRLGYDVQITPTGNGSTAQDVNGRAGLSWMF